MPPSEHRYVSTVQVAQALGVSEYAQIYRDGAKSSEWFDSPVRSLASRRVHFMKSADLFDLPADLS